MRSASSPPSSPAMPTTRRGSDIAWCPSCGEPMAMSIRESYDSVARTYAAHLASELSGKPLDRHLLNRFAEEVRGRGLVADLGCGPGHVARYLHDQGVTMVGIDLSPQMIEEARRLNPELEFRVGDMRKLSLPDASLVGAIAFYSIVHFARDELLTVMGELRRAIALGGLALVAFHVGRDVVHVGELFGAQVNLDFRLHAPADVVAALSVARLAVIEHVEREPYEGAEYLSRRC